MAPCAEFVQSIRFLGGFETTSLLLDREPFSLKGVMGECRLRECFDLSSDEAACNSLEGCTHDPDREACHEEGVEAYDCRSFVLANICSSEARCVCE